MKYNKKNKIQYFPLKILFTLGFLLSECAPAPQVPSKVKKFISTSKVGVSAGSLESLNSCSANQKANCFAIEKASSKTIIRGKIKKIENTFLVVSNLGEEVTINLVNESTNTASLQLTTQDSSDTGSNNLPIVSEQEATTLDSSLTPVINTPINQTPPTSSNTIVSLQNPIVSPTQQTGVVSNQINSTSSQIGQPLPAQTSTPSNAMVSNHQEQISPTTNQQNTLSSTPLDPFIGKEVQFAGFLEKKIFYGSDGKELRVTKTVVADLNDIREVDPLEDMLSCSFQYHQNCHIEKQDLNSIESVFFVEKDHGNNKVFLKYNKNIFYVLEKELENTLTPFLGQLIKCKLDYRVYYTQEQINQNSGPVFSVPVVESCQAQLLGKNLSYPEICELAKLCKESKIVSPQEGETEKTFTQNGKLLYMISEKGNQLVLRTENESLLLSGKNAIEFISFENQDVVASGKVKVFNTIEFSGDQYLTTIHFVENMRSLDPTDTMINLNAQVTRLEGKTYFTNSSIVDQQKYYLDFQYTPGYLELDDAEKEDSFIQSMDDYFDKEKKSFDNIPSSTMVQIIGINLGYSGKPEEKGNKVIVPISIIEKSGNKVLFPFFDYETKSSNLPTLTPGKNHFQILSIFSTLSAWKLSDISDDKFHTYITNELYYRQIKTLQRNRWPMLQYIDEDGESITILLVDDGRAKNKKTESNPNELQDYQKSSLYQKAGTDQMYWIIGVVGNDFLDKIGNRYWFAYVYYKNKKPEKMDCNKMIASSIICIDNTK